WRRTTCALAFGGFAISLGAMLAAGAPMSEALRLAIRGVRSDLAKDRLQVVLQQVRQGVSLSQALQDVKGFPQTIVRLVSVGESTGALGRMLQRSGKLEEDAAVRDTEAAARLLGPALIVLLGGLIGLMMAGLLSGVTELGQAALN
ncbi:MAG TPA: type II secretion system F family protein, partial [Caulobacter sp.]|nr:type II secretion system F family protein [Caulobacter sp.]